MVAKFSSINMKMSATKVVMDLKGELKLITSTDSTWDTWCCVYDNHNNGKNVNMKTVMKYTNGPKMKVPPILREFFGPLYKLMELHLLWATQHILQETPKKTFPYPNIFLKHTRYIKPSTYHIKEWCEYQN